MISQNLFEQTTDNCLFSIVMKTGNIKINKYICNHVHPAYNTLKILEIGGMMCILLIFYDVIPFYSFMKFSSPLKNKWIQ